MNQIFKTRAEVLAAGLEPFFAAQAIAALPPEPPPPPTTVSEEQRQQVQILAGHIKQLQTDLSAAERNAREIENNLEDWRRAEAAAGAKDPRVDDNIKDYMFAAARVEMGARFLGSCARWRDMLCQGAPSKLAELDGVLNQIFPSRRRSRGFTGGDTISSRLTTAVWAAETVLNSGKDIPDPPLSI